MLVRIRRRTESKTVTQSLASLDLPGAVLFSGAITMLLLPLQLGGVWFQWSSSPVIGMFVGLALTFAVFIGWTIYRQERALIPPRMFTVNRNPPLLCAAAFFKSATSFHYPGAAPPETRISSIDFRIV